MSPAILKTHLASMAHRNSTSHATRHLGFRWLLVPMLFVPVVALLITPDAPRSFMASAQRSAQRQKPRPTSQRSKPTDPAPTPTPSVFDSLGEPPPAPSRSPKVDEEVNPGEVISVTTTEVMLPVSVRDANGRFASDLTRKDFRIFEDGREQLLSDLALRQVPVDVVLMVDASSSVATNLDDFRSAAEGFATRLAAEDRISLITFDDRVQLLQDWTRSRFQLRRALNRIEPGIFTRFNDALLLAARQQFGSGKSRRP